MDKLWCEEEADTGASTDVELVTVSECINRRKKTWERGNVREMMWQFPISNGIKM